MNFFPTKLMEKRKIIPRQQIINWEDISQKDLASMFHLPIQTVAERLGICATMLKKLCRQHGIQRWPHRKIQSLNHIIEQLKISLSQPNLTPEMVRIWEEELKIIKAKKRLILENPNIEIDITHRGLFNAATSSEESMVTKLQKRTEKEKEPEEHSVGSISEEEKEPIPFYETFGTEDQPVSVKVLPPQKNKSTKIHKKHGTGERRGRKKKYLTDKSLTSDDKKFLDPLLLAVEEAEREEEQKKRDAQREYLQKRIAAHRQKKNEGKYSYFELNKENITLNDYIKRNIVESLISNVVVEEGKKVKLKIQEHLKRKFKEFEKPSQLSIPEVNSLSPPLTPTSEVGTETDFSLEDFKRLEEKRQKVVKTKDVSVSSIHIETQDFGCEVQECDFRELFKSSPISMKAQGTSGMVVH